MGIAPPKAAVPTPIFPLPPAQGTVKAYSAKLSVNLSASLSFSTPAIEICGFGIPSFKFSLLFSLLDFSFLFSWPPTFFLDIQLPCGLNIAVGVPSGGGRVGVAIQDPSAVFT